MVKRHIEKIERNTTRRKMYEQRKRKEKKTLRIVRWDNLSQSLTKCNLPGKV